MSEVEVLEDQPCPMCHKETLTLREMKRDIPYFGACYVFSMDCSNCDYHMADVEAEEPKGKAKFSIEIDSEEDLNIRIVKGSQATIKIPRLVEVSPGPISNGYVTNIEGVLKRVRSVLEGKRNDDDKKVRNKAKRQLKKIQRVLWGRESIKLIIEDPSGNSAIVSEKAKKS